VNGKQDTYYSDSPYEYIKGMLSFLVENIYVVVGDQVFQQFAGILMGTNWAPLLADLILYSYESEFVQEFLRDKMIILKNTQPCPSTMRADISMIF
jgi:hypothetical protein